VNGQGLRDLGVFVKENESNGFVTPFARIFGFVMTFMEARRAVEAIHGCRLTFLTCHLLQRLGLARRRF